MDLIPQNIGTFLVQSPLYLVWLAGIILAIIYWRSQPSAALLTLIALLILVIYQVLLHILFNLASICTTFQRVTIQPRLDQWWRYSR